MHKVGNNATTREQQKKLSKYLENMYKVVQCSEIHASIMLCDVYI